MKSVSRIKWVSDDGIEFESSEACLHHERRVKFRAGLVDFFQKTCNISEQQANAMVSPRDDDVWAVIRDNAEEFQNVLKFAMRKAKGRKRNKPTDKPDQT